MRKIVECVPNFSEGRDQEKIRQIADAIQSEKEVRLLNVESNADHNRTVMTFVGEPEPVLRAAYQSIAKAVEVIDMSVHSGGHPRIGACDVCPFIPVSRVSMAECVRLAKLLGDLVGRELKIPVYLYERAATYPERRNLAVVRKGEYEGLERKLRDPKWYPDFGSSVFNAKSGAVIIGARPFLVAYNINLATSNLSVAKKIAEMIRESGGIDKERHLRVPGCLKSVKALGLSLDEYHGEAVQVSINLTDLAAVPIHIVFETVRSLAALAGVRIFESEIVGVAPKKALIAAGQFYSREEKSEDKLIQAAIKNLKLKQFDPRKKIIELLLAE